MTEKVFTSNIVFAWSTVCVSSWPFSRTFDVNTENRKKKREPIFYRQMGFQFQKESDDSICYLHNIGIVSVWKKKKRQERVKVSNESILQAFKIVKIMS